MSESRQNSAIVTRTPLWIRILLVLSLGVNLLIAGIVIGAVATRGGADGPRTNIGAARDLGPLPFVMALEPADRRALGGALRSEARSLQENRAALRNRFEALLGALRAEEFDRDAVGRLLNEQRELGVRRQQIGERILLDRLESMSAEERRAYADRLDRSLRRAVR